MSKSVPCKTPSRNFIVYVDQKAGGGVYGWQPYAAFLVEGKARDGSGLMCRLPLEELNLPWGYGDRFLVTVAPIKPDLKIRERGRKAELAYAAKARRHLKKAKRT